MVASVHVLLACCWAGTWPLLKYVVDGSSSSGKAKRTTTGVGSNTVIVFDYDGKPSIPIATGASTSVVSFIWLRFNLMVQVQSRFYN